MATAVKKARGKLQLLFSTQLLPLLPDSIACDSVK